MQPEQRIAETCASKRPAICEIATALHADPETAFNEVRACLRLGSALGKVGFDVTIGVGGVPTAFLAEIGAGPGPTIAILAEYDALPNLGHACGHNIIAAAAVGAGLVLAASGVPLPGRLLVIGTPAEEGGGGKILLLEAGVFHDVDAALMIHPGTRNIVDRGSLASTRITLTFAGESQSADDPHTFLANPLDAVLQTFAAINHVRSQMRPDSRIHGIITDGGINAARIPGRAEAQFSVRAGDREYAAGLVAALKRCAEAAALATGTTVTFLQARSYENVVPNRVIAAEFAKHLVASGRVVDAATGRERMGSTDMGNVTQVLPGIHAYVQIADVGISAHSMAFRDASNTPRALQGAMDGAVALAQTAYRLLTDAAFLGRAQSEFERRRLAGVVIGKGTTAVS